jgi:glutathione synthase/RimK-type ligase-like ATP-grasp enzyme
MVRVLIPTQLNDSHAIVVGKALRAKGHEAFPWHGADFPTRQQVSVEISPEAGFDLRIEGPGVCLANASFDVVWYRRPTRPVLSEETGLHAGDLQIAKRECNAFYSALWHLISPDAFWVNPAWAAERTNAKPLQVTEAVKAGLTVPPTLFSTDPEQIRRFLGKHQGEVIYKAFTPVQWRTADGVAFSFTSEVSLDDLPDDDVLRLSPGIFQRKVKKAQELRVTCMGNHVVAASLQPQAGGKAQIDWRASFSKLKAEKAVLPENVRLGCLALMRRMGIVFGCFDFIVTPENDYVFLEVNEMGQFLWLDAIDPDFMLLDAFCEFLISRRSDFTWAPSKSSVHFEELNRNIREELAQDAAVHVAQPEYGLVAD